MKLQFDANQQYQLDAVAAVTDLFEGQPQGAPEYSVIQVGDWGGLFAGQARTELGTGKTYVHLRTIFELSRRYGFQKFIIVVPSVAIREGVLKNLEITAEHFRALYNNLPFEHFVYDAKKVNRFLKLRTSEADKVRCGKKHFETLGVPFAVVVSADEV
jgi:restriction endonuclease